MNAHKMPTNSSSTPASPTLNAVSITHVSHSRRYTVVPNNRFILCSSSNDTEHVSGDRGSLKNTCSNAAVYLLVWHFFLVSVIFCDLFTLFRKSTQACSMPEHTHGGQGTALRRISCHLPCWRSLSPQFCCYALYSGYLTRKLPLQHRRAEIAVWVIASSNLLGPPRSNVGNLASIV